MHDAGSVGPTFAIWRHAQGCSSFLIRRASRAQSHNRAKAAKSGRPPRAPQAGVAVPDGPA
eukprot:1951192-Prymnesium_polylepis.1